MTDSVARRERGAATKNDWGAKVCVAGDLPARPQLD